MPGAGKWPRELNGLRRCCVGTKSGIDLVATLLTETQGIVFCATIRRCPLPDYNLSRAASTALALIGIMANVYVWVGRVP